ncbi:pyruvate formate lyase family protein [Treponema primitia]|uniref:pyruvate formate lyase family protein n=1 Tax=Treponema primitia TaxID=88058 RepID=UPI00025556DE|nr:pyruvate formate lyase family protein [Treponema primitia]
MTKTPEMSTEIKTLYDNFYGNYDESLVWKRNHAFIEAIQQKPNASKALQHARGLKKFLLEKNVVVRDWDILAGHTQYTNTTASIPIKYVSKTEPHNIVESFDPTNPSDFVWDFTREISNYKELRGGNYTAEEEELFAYFSSGIECGLGKRWSNGHLIAGYKYVITQGYKALEKQLQNNYNKSEGDRKEYFEAMITAVQAAEQYIGRYEEAARETLKKDLTRSQKKYIERIAEACGNIKTKGVSNFFEAVQALILLHEMLLFENHTGSMSLGRLDQVFYPYYKKDREDNKLSLTETEDIIEALWLKFATVIMGFQNVTVGGCDSCGKSLVNDLTLILLRASRKLKQDQPLLSLRVTKDMSDECWEEAIALITQGGGFPALFNDDVIIPSKEALGVNKSDAWDYGIVGCVEPSISGKEYSNTEELRFNWAKVIELMLSGGKCTVTGIKLGLANPKDLDEIKNFDEFYSWYKKEFTIALQKFMKACNLLDTVYPYYFPSPLLSATYDGCVKKGEDASALGPDYCFSTANACGMANAVDSLIAIKQIVFDKKMVTLKDFSKALAGNFIGFEQLQGYAQNRCLKYGNDIPEADKYMKEITDLYCATVRDQKNNRGYSYQAGLYTVHDQSVMGKKTGALPDGREKCISLSNAISAVQGMDTKGPTAAAQSALVFDHKQAANGLVFDLKFNPAFFEKESHKEMLRTLVEGYFEGGGMEVQFNVVSRETLLDAKRNPQKHRNLVVRVSGFSAYFVTLDPVLQDEIINRTENNGI